MEEFLKSINEAQNQEEIDLITQQILSMEFNEHVINEFIIFFENSPENIQLKTSALLVLSLKIHQTWEFLQESAKIQIRNSIEIILSNTLNIDHKILSKFTFELLNFLINEKLIDQNFIILNILNETTTNNLITYSIFTKSLSKTLYYSKSYELMNIFYNIHESSIFSLISSANTNSSKKYSLLSLMYVSNYLEHNQEKNERIESLISNYPLSLLLNDSSNEDVLASYIRLVISLVTNNILTNEQLLLDHIQIFLNLLISSNSYSIRRRIFEFFQIQNSTIMNYVNTHLNSILYNLISSIFTPETLEIHLIETNPISFCSTNSFDGISYDNKADKLTLAYRFIRYLTKTFENTSEVLSLIVSNAFNQFQEDPISFFWNMSLVYCGWKDFYSKNEDFFNNFLKQSEIVLESDSILHIIAVLRLISEIELPISEKIILQIFHLADCDDIRIKYFSTYALSKLFAGPIDYSIILSDIDINQLISLFFGVSHEFSDPDILRAVPSIFESSKENLLSNSQDLIELFFSRLDSSVNCSDIFECIKKLIIYSNEASKEFLDQNVSIICEFIQEQSDILFSGIFSVPISDILVICSCYTSNDALWAIINSLSSDFLVNCSKEVQTNFGVVIHNIALLDANKTVEKASLLNSLFLFSAEINLSLTSYIASAMLQYGDMITDAADFISKILANLNQISNFTEFLYTIFKLHPSAAVNIIGTSFCLIFEEFVEEANSTLDSIYSAISIIPYLDTQSAEIVLKSSLCDVDPSFIFDESVNLVRIPDNTERYQTVLSFLKNLNETNQELSKVCGVDIFLEKVQIIELMQTTSNEEES